MPEEQQFQDRQIAYKVRIGDLINGEYIEQEGWKPNYVVVGDRKISRVNIIAGVIDKQIGENLSTLTVDDGSGNIQIRAFKEDSFKLQNIEIGDIVIIIGRPRRNFNQYFVSYEIVKKLDPAWAKVRLKELEKAFGLNPSPNQSPLEKNFNEENANPHNNIQEEKIEASPQVVEEKVEEAFEKKPLPNQPPLEKNIDEEKKKGEKVLDDHEERKNILEMVKSSDEGEGAEVEGVISNSGLDREKVEKILDELVKAGEIYENVAGRVKLL